MATKLKVSSLGRDVPISFPEAAILCTTTGLPHPLYKSNGGSGDEVGDFLSRITQGIDFSLYGRFVIHHDRKQNRT